METADNLNYEDVERYKQTWSGKYKGISYSIVFWTTLGMGSGRDQDIYPNKGIWNSYIFINKRMIPREFNGLIPKLTKSGIGDRKYFEYHDLENLFNMSGGLTHFELMYGDEGDLGGFRVGNDYNHSWNGVVYFEEILTDVKSSIDTFISNYPKYKAWSIINGKWVQYKNLEAYNNKHRTKMKELQ